MIRNRYTTHTQHLPTKAPKGKKDALKPMAPQSKHCKQKVKRTVSFPKFGQTAIQSENFTRTYMQRHTTTEIVYHSRSIALERSVIFFTGGLISILGGYNPHLCSAVVYTRHLLSTRKGFLTHQCNISENIKIKRIQR